MKKIISIAMVLVLALTCFAGCGKKAEEPKAEETAASDLAYVKEKGKLVVGITDFAPMDYQEKSSDEWIGFDADMAKAFANYLGVEAEFIVIEWDSKVLELDGKKIDCVWNGMTLGDEVLAAMSCSEPYCNNQQVVVCKKDNAAKYNSAEACKDIQFAVEAGSAGEKMAKEYQFNYTPVTAQADALLEVASGTSDASIIDSLMAAAMVGEGTGYADLTYTVGLNDEEYGVGFRKGSDITAELNKFFKQSAEDGTTEKIAEKYNVQAALIK